MTYVFFNSYDIGIIFRSKAYLSMFNIQKRLRIPSITGYNNKLNFYLISTLYRIVTLQLGRLAMFQFDEQTLFLGNKINTS